MFENRYIREKMVKPYLRVIAADPKGQDPLPDTRLLPIVQDWHEMFYSAMRAQGWDGEKQLFYKGAKMCLMWPVWSTAFPYAKWVFVKRDVKGIIESCLRTPFMNAYKEAEDWQKWVEHHIRCLTEMEEEHLDMLEIWTPSIIKGNLSEVEEMVKWLGLEWKEDEVKKFISPELWHGGTTAS
jgi:hypothetical protein